MHRSGYKLLRWYVVALLIHCCERLFGPFYYLFSFQFQLNERTAFSYDASSSDVQRWIGRENEKIEWKKKMGISTNSGWATNKLLKRKLLVYTKRRRRRQRQSKHFMCNVCVCVFVLHSEFNIRGALDGYILIHWIWLWYWQFHFKSICFCRFSARTQCARSFVLVYFTARRFLSLLYTLRARSAPFVTDKN